MYTLADVVRLSSRANQAIRAPFEEACLADAERHYVRADEQAAQGNLKRARYLRMWGDRAGAQSC